MKVLHEHYSYMKTAMQAIKEQIPSQRQFIIKEGRSKDIEQRLRWDCLWAAGLWPWVCSEIYKYANDSHIDTALKRIMKELGE